MFTIGVIHLYHHLDEILYEIIKLPLLIKQPSNWKLLIFIETNAFANILLLEMGMATIYLQKGITFHDSKELATSVCKSTSLS
jgi:hypothetical protein